MYAVASASSSSPPANIVPTDQRTDTKPVKGLLSKNGLQHMIHLQGSESGSDVDRTQTYTTT